jgi:hypothetical protein
VGTLRELALVVIVLSACAEPAERPEGAPVENAVDAAAGCQQFALEGLKLKARSRAGLEAEAGRPLKTTVRVEPNRHVPNVQDSIFKFDYEGLSVQMRKPGPGGEMFEYVAVSHRKWLNFPFFKPGASVDNIVKAIGEPQRREGNNLVYTCGGGEVENPVVFETKDGAVQRIVFNYYVD